MKKNFSFGVGFCYPEGKLTDLGKFATKLAGAGTPGGGLIMEGTLALFKSILGGLPVQSSLAIDDNYIKITPPKYANIIVDGISEITIPKSEVVKVEKTYNFLLFQNVIIVTLKTMEIKFLIHPVFGKAGEIRDAIKRLI